jgi:hypothetical protein
MNWRRGLLRLWVVGSICWVGFVGWGVYGDTVANARKMACVDQQKITAEPENVFACFDPGYSDLYPIYAKSLPQSTALALEQHAAMLILPPLLILAFGVGLAWALTGFRRTRE